MSVGHFKMFKKNNIERMTFKNKSKPYVNNG